MDRRDSQRNMELNSAGQVFYISSECAKDGNSQAGLLEDLLDRVLPGDRIILTAGEHNLPLLIKGLRGHEKQPIEIFGEAGAVIDVRMTSASVIELVDCTWVNIRNLTLRGGVFYGVSLRHCNDCIVENLTIDDTRGEVGIRVIGYSRPLPRRADRYEEKYLQFPYATGNRIASCAIKGPTLGIELDYACENTITNNTTDKISLVHSFSNSITGSGKIVASAECRNNGPDINSISLKPSEKEKKGISKLIIKTKEDLEKYTPFRFSCDDESLEILVRNTLFLLCQHINPDGWVGIWPNLKILEELELDDPVVAQQPWMHGRDAMEAANVYTLFGALELAESSLKYLISYGISNRAWGYDEQAEVGPMSGEQTDVVSHLARAMYTFWKLRGDSEWIADGTENAIRKIMELEKYYISSFKLYRNTVGEQLAKDDGRFAGLFENAAIEDGLRKLTELAINFGQGENAAWAHERSEQISQGIETHLRDEKLGYMYAVMLGKEKTDLYDPPVQGPEFSCLGWHRPLDKSALLATYERVLQNTVPWGCFRVPITRIVDGCGQMYTLVKDLAGIIAYEADTGKMGGLSGHLNFLINGTRKPWAVFPDHYTYYSPYAKRDDYPWNGIVQDPQGDASFGINNCEQSAEFLKFFVESLLGYNCCNDKISISPSLPLVLRYLKVEGVPLPIRVGGKNLDFSQSRTENSVMLEWSGITDAVCVSAGVMIPKDVSEIMVELNGESSTYDLEKLQEVDRVCCTGRGPAIMTVTWKV